MKSKLQEEIQSLPTALSGRICIHEDRPDAEGGAYVLYWMHHAVRGHENPALDVALAMANRRRLPVVVYQGLGGRHPYNNDRHHTFIMQGASDAHEQLRRLGVRALFHLDPTGSGESPLRKLAVRAAMVVVEDFPAPPFPSWTRLLANHSPCSVLAVDCACIVPMRQQPHRFERAYEFRRHNKAEFECRVTQSWPMVKPIIPKFDGPLDVVSLELDSAEFDEICARCNMDHSIPPVAHTRGGSAAGYPAWRLRVPFRIRVIW